MFSQSGSMTRIILRCSISRAGDGEFQGVEAMFYRAAGVEGEKIDGVLLIV
jgi:hypothetical protein